MNNFILSTLMLLFAFTSQAAVFSSDETGNWSSATTWSVTGFDADGIPDVDDDVTISTTHTVTLTTSSFAKTLVINGGGVFDGANVYLYLKGNFTNNGSTLRLRFYFISTTSTVTSSTPLSVSIFNIRSSTINIPAGTQVNCGTTSIQFHTQGGSIVNNSGTLNLAGINNLASTCVFNNLTGGTLIMKYNLPTNITLNSSTNSTITFLKELTNLPTWTYHHLNLQGSVSTKTAAAAVVINGDLVINSGVTFRLNSQNLSLVGNLSNSGSITTLSNFNLTGTSDQTISSTAAITIPAMTSTNPATIILNTGTYTIGTSSSFLGNLTLNAAATLNLNSMPFTIGGNLTNMGTLSNAAAVTFNGTTAAQTISFNANHAFTDVTSNNASGVSVTSGNHTITNSLTVSAGNLNVGSNLMTLVSDATKTAYIANSAGTLSGSMIVQRYVDARPTNWHDFSSPVAVTTIDDWDNETYMSIGAPNDTPGYPGGDGSASGDFSVYEWNPNTDANDVVYTGTVLDVGKGYTVFLGDDLTNWPGRAIDSRGTPNMGTVNIPTTYNAASAYPGWNLVGNPHAAFIEWNDVVTASSLVDPTIEMFDNSGNYQSYTAPVEIPAGQGLYAYIGDGGSLVVPQSAKRTTTTSNFNRMMPTRNYDLKLRLSSNSNPFYHEIKVVYDNKSSAKFEKGKDAPFIKSPKQYAPSVTFVDGNSRFIRNLINTQDETVSLPLEINARVEGNYTIELEGLFGSDGYSSAYILNNVTNEKFELNDGASVNMYLEGGDKTYNEFSLVLSKKKSENMGSIAESAEGVSIFATSENINIKGNLDKALEVKVQVYNIMGQLITEKTEMLSPNSSILLPTSELNSEVYVIKVTTNDNRQFTNRVVVAK